VPKSKIRGAIPPIPNTLSWNGAQLKKKAQGQLYFNTTIYRYITVNSQKIISLHFIKCSQYKIIFKIKVVDFNEICILWHISIVNVICSFKENRLNSI